MPNRNDTRGFGGPGQGEDDRDRRDREARGGPTRGPVRGDEGRAFGDPGFRAEDARLNAELNRYDRQRGRPARVEYGHDQNYRPGYHAGGSRFGFFGLGHDPEPRPRNASDVRDPQPYGGPIERAYHPDADYDFDPDYLHWRDQQMRRHDHHYADWRRHQHEQYDEEYRRFRDERRDDFHERFQDWRARRDAAAAAAAAAAEVPNPDDKL